MADSREVDISLESMIMTFRVSELQMLLGFAGRNKTGRKNELQVRALELLRLRSHPVQLKIRELYQAIQAEQLVDTSAEQTTQRSYQTRLASIQQQSTPTSKAAPPAHQSSMLQNSINDRSNPAYRTSGFTCTTAQPQGYLGKTMLPVLQIQPNSQYPVHPDVKLKKLPFYDLLGELLKPSSLMPQGTGLYQENIFVFHLTPQQSSDIASSRNCQAGAKLEYAVQVQMRFCLQETSCEQEDHFPPNLRVKVNGKFCTLPNPIPTNKPGVEPTRPSRPVNISPLVKLSPSVGNQISVGWTSDYNKQYAIAIYLVRKLSSTELLSRLKQRGARHSDYTRGLIKEKLNEDADSEIATTSLRVSVACPLGKMRMTTPCRSSTCSHLQCFDASLFLQMNERKPTWNCPVCDKPAMYDNIVIDGYFQEVLTSKKLLPDINEIQLLQDGSWENLALKKEKTKDKNNSESGEPTKVDVTVDLEDTNSSEFETPSKPMEKKRAVVIDLISDSENEDDAPATKKAALGSSPKKCVSGVVNSSVMNAVSKLPECTIIELE